MSAGLVGTIRPVRLGYHGKVPSRGDFVSRELHRGFQADLDQWLQNFVRSGREAMGERWLDAFLTAPIWHFVLRRDEATFAGSMIPSVDAVGRYFPFVMVLQPDGKDADIGAIDHLLTTVEPLLLAVLDEDFDIEDLNHRMARFLTKPQRPAPLLPTLALPERFQYAPSLWWTKGSDRRPSTMMAFGDWPPAQAAISFLEEPPDLLLETLWGRCEDLSAAVTSGGTLALDEIAVEYEPDGTAYAATGDCGTVMSDGRIGGRYEPTAARLLCHAIAEGTADPERIERFIRRRLRDQARTPFPYLSYVHAHFGDGQRLLEVSGDYSVWTADGDHWQPLTSQPTDDTRRPDDNLVHRLDVTQATYIVCTTESGTQPSTPTAIGTQDDAARTARRLFEEALVAGIPTPAVLFAMRATQRPLPEATTAS